MLLLLLSRSHPPAVRAARAETGEPGCHQSCGLMWGVTLPPIIRRRSPPAGRHRVRAVVVVRDVRALPTRCYAEGGRIPAAGRSAADPGTCAQSPRRPTTVTTVNSTAATPAAVPIPADHAGECAAITPAATVRVTVTRTATTLLDRRNHGAPIDLGARSSTLTFVRPPSAGWIQDGRSAPVLLPTGPAPPSVLGTVVQSRDASSRVKFTATLNSRGTRCIRTVRETASLGWAGMQKYQRGWVGM